ncbi:phosphoglycerate dehydrogenase [Streptomyces avermitilis]|uniref:Glycerate dehydrogenase n=2 Tax=Streptomyces avermitilis TaxID=33903 RepID=Q825H6_STRAW|nr:MULTISPECIES: NAD(P)-dependent oxidoreductase [Streptomyces]KUN50084.1 phosphoglycerate dehydrogenase [Streptomyces avermitilis]MYT03018.1 phosphoglycerate dehydrogenase [Streptomyces sp. SID5469]OOV26156.1 phosphoglycerate dehydrogenase [Streptomyces avermitilis]BAC75192.1 putative glycerate dehydrogenase [Streptomyces avermitilis MA-4680 = NBRC 14893]BBJ55845.1 2-hydroxyacid dehydrogenase [Streptomyces avermitilis]
MTVTKNVLAVVPPHVGGRGAGAALASVFPGQARVTVVEATDEDPAALREAHVIITGLGPVTAEHIAAAPELQLIQCASHGFDYVDLDAARARGLPVCNIGSSGAEQQNVAEQTFALMLALAKQLVPAHTALVDADWALPRLQRSITELSGKTLGIVGLGHIGEEVARRAVAFDMRIVYAGRERVGAEREARLGGARHVGLDELLRTADYVTLHAPLTEATRHLLDADRLALLKPTAFVINTARGALIDQDALADALEKGALAGAGIDVFDPEPPTSALRLLRAPNVVLSPHVAGVTRETLVRIALAAVQNAADFVAGETPRDLVS